MIPFKVWYDNKRLRDSFLSGYLQFKEGYFRVIDRGAEEGVSRGNGRCVRVCVRECLGGNLS